MEGIQAFWTFVMWLVVALVAIILLMVFWYFVGRHITIAWGWR